MFDSVRLLEMEDWLGQVKNVWMVGRRGRKLFLLVLKVDDNDELNDEDLRAIIPWRKANEEKTVLDLSEAIMTSRQIASKEQ